MRRQAREQIAYRLYLNGMKVARVVNEIFKQNVQIEDIGGFYCKEVAHGILVLWEEDDC